MYYLNIYFKFLLLFSLSLYSVEAQSVRESVVNAIQSSEYVVSCDGGGSNTRFSVFDKNGELLDLFQQDNNASTELEAGSSNINSVGEKGVQETLDSLFSSLKVGNDKLTVDQWVAEAVFVGGIAGLTVGTNKAIFQSLLQKYGFKPDKIILDNDAKMILELAEGPSVVLISGTGSVCFGKNDSQQFRCGGLGWYLGDEGSGFSIGKSAIKYALDYEKGWGQKTTLTSSIDAFCKSHFNINTLDNLNKAMLSGSLPPSDVAKVAPTVFQEFHAGDPIAKKIISDAAADLAYLLDSVFSQMNTSQNTRVYLIGGVFKGEGFMKQFHDVLQVKKVKEKFAFNIIDLSRKNAINALVHETIKG